MTEAPKDTRKTLAERRRSRVVLSLLVVALLAVITVSLATNLTRMYNRWDEVGKSSSVRHVEAKLERIEIVSGDRRHSFMIEMARTDGDRARGLMFRASIPQDSGMLFDFERDQMISMWMKNTYVSLDMVFIFADGRIHRIESRTEPQSERVISSGVPVRAVLELNGNMASRLGLRPGDRVLHPMFK